MENLLTDIKILIVNTLELEDIDPSNIGDEEALFDEGLGLDSIDALELGIALQKTYGIEIDEEDESLPEHFQSARALAKFVEANRT
ncbi:MAG: phosphopantetheine-binding protein [Gammaproteobacteria bacterium]|nr:phosphopantetheine-binding protein [Gammaproteobacteria bacterium]